MTTINIYPGMMDNSTEFFIHNNEVKVMHAGVIKDFTDISFQTISLINEKINESNEVKLALHDMQPLSEIKRIEQFVRCRFGGLDFKADIINNELQDGEYWECPNRGICPHEGTLCKLPLFNEHRLTTQDVKLMQLTTTNKTNEVIADEMNLPFGSFHLLKKLLYSILGVQTKQEIAVISRTLNLI
jgi:hypothetical protein